jgi:hypothetical protein
MNSVKDGSVTVATLQLLKEHSEQYYKLGKIYQKNQSGAKDFRYDFSQRKDELDAFVKLKNQLECFIGLISKFRSGTLNIPAFLMASFKQTPSSNLLHG